MLITVRIHHGFTFNSDTVDKPLYGLALITLNALIKEVPPEFIDVVEYPIGQNYLYRFSSRGLTAYLGRDKDTARIKYLMIDNARFHWARLEGFYDDPEFTRDDVYSKIGAMQKILNINEFINFLTGHPFKTVGPYIRD